MIIEQFSKVRPNGVKENWYLLNTEFGQCQMRKTDYDRGLKPNIKSAVNKLEYFKNECNKIHNNKYDYSLVNYEHIHDVIQIICPEHGEFLQTPHSHLRGGRCHTCARLSHKDKVTRTQDEFIKLAKEVHGDKYDYSKTNYNTSSDKIIIGCPVHGEFKQRASSHLKYGCARCGADAIMHTTESFIKRAKKLHKNRFDYSKTVYEHSTKPVTIICKEHGEFTQIASEHIRSRAPGCKSCFYSKGEGIITDILMKNKIKFIREHKLGYTKYRYDFYLPDINVLIEYDGELHYIAVDYFGGVDTLNKIKNNDSIKNVLAETHNIPLIRIPYTHIGYLKDSLNSKLRMYVKYKRDGKYFKNFLEYAKHFGLDGDAKSIDHKQYLFKLK